MTNSQGQALTLAMNNDRISADAKQIREMNLGISSVKFQYLHILTLLLKNDRASNIRLSCAREAISLLPSLVSNWGSVYNGVIWYGGVFPNPLKQANSNLHIGSFCIIRSLLSS